MVINSSGTERTRQRQDEIDILFGLASAFYLFRRFEKSFAVVSLVEQLDPERQAALELKSALLCEMSRFSEAISLLTLLERRGYVLSQEARRIKRRAIMSKKAT